MYSFFQKVIDQGFALVYIDDILLLGHVKKHMLDLIEQLLQICSDDFNIAPENSFFILLTVKSFGHEIGKTIMKPKSSKNDGIQKLKTPTLK